MNKIRNRQSLTYMPHTADPTHSQTSIAGFYSSFPLIPQSYCSTWPRELSNDHSRSCRRSPSIPAPCHLDGLSLSVCVGEGGE